MLQRPSPTGRRAMGSQPLNHENCDGDEPKAPCWCVVHIRLRPMRGSSGNEYRLNPLTPSRSTGLCGLRNIGRLMKPPDRDVRRHGSSWITKLHPGGMVEGECAVASIRRGARATGSTSRARVKRGRPSHDASIPR